MKKGKVFCSMEHIDYDLINEAETYKVVKKKIRWTKGAAIAACFCLVTGSVTALAATGFGTRLIESFTARRVGSNYIESGFDLSVAIERVSVDDLSKDIQNASDIIKQQYADRKPYDNWFSGVWVKDFTSRNEACDYVGIKQIRKFDYDWVEQTNTLNVLGNKKGQILNINIETYYNVNDIRMQLFTQVFTKHYDEKIIVRARTTEDIGFTESFFTTDNNISCHVLESSALGSGYLSMDGYIVSDGILYNLHIAYLEKDSNQAIKLLHQWADLF